MPNTTDYRKTRRNLLLICGSGETYKLPGSYKSIANSGLEINSKSRDLLLISGPEFAIDLWFLNQEL